jgi:hypothetical protein
MPPTADSLARPPQPAGIEVSGKFVIIGILGLALVAAGGRWLFRYNATHRVVNLWGRNAVQLIRDAPEVNFMQVPQGLGDLLDPEMLHEIRQLDPKNVTDISHAHGLAHLRNALLEDQSFNWEPPKGGTSTASWVLKFRNPGTNDEAYLAFTTHGERCALLVEGQRPPIVLCEPISKGLLEMFEEFTASKPADSPVKTER